MTEELDRQLARRILDRMGSTGQPPERGARRVNVGTDDLLDLLRTEYLVPIRDSGRLSSFKLVQATFGGGKTHFLHCLREIAWEERFVTSLVGLSREVVPCDNPVLVYQAVARQIEGSPGHPAEEGNPGIDAFLRLEVERRIEGQAAPQVSEWLRTDFARTPVESHGVRKAAQEYMLGILDGDDERTDLAGAFLRGEEVTREEARTLGIRESLDRPTAFRFLRSLVQILRGLDVPGVVLLFDEMDRVMSLPAGRRRNVADTIREVIDACGQERLPSVLWVYAAPPEFMTNLVPDYPALQQRLAGAAAFAPINPLGPIIDLEQLGIEPAELFEWIGLRLLEVYETAFDAALDPGIQKANLQRLARYLGEAALETGARRTFVRAAVRLLTEQHRGAARRLTDPEIAALAGSVPSCDAPPHPDEEQFQ